MIVSKMAKYYRDLDRIFQALADPTRRAMLARLGQGPLAVSALAGPTGLALPTVLRHLSVLEDAGLIDTQKTGRTRLCRILPETLAVPADWLARQRAERGADQPGRSLSCNPDERPETMTLDPDTDLVLTRDIAAPAALLYQCWTTPDHLVHWFVPKPHLVTACTLDVCAGGACNITFNVDGTVMENKGIYLEVVPNEKLVFTDTYTEGWKPAPEPFMTAIVTFDDLGDGRTRYTAVVRHRNAEAAKTHKDMGFFDGWGTVATQLEEYARGLMP